MSVDPVGFSGGNVHSFNRYAYANNNPYRLKDPDGRFALDALVVTGLVLGGGVIYVAKREGCKQSVGRVLGAAGNAARNWVANERVDGDGKTGANAPV